MYQRQSPLSQHSQPLHFDRHFHSGFVNECVQMLHVHKYTDSIQIKCRQSCTAISTFFPD